MSAHADKRGRSENGAASHEADADGVSGGKSDPNNTASSDPSAPVKKKRKSGWDDGPSADQAPDVPVSPAAAAVNGGGLPHPHSPSANPALASAAIQAFIQQQVRLEEEKRVLSSANLSRRIYVGNINYDLVEDDIKSPFTAFGRVVRVDMPREKNGKSKGFCFIEFDNDESATAAINTMDNYPFLNRQLRVRRPTAMPTPGQPMPTQGAQHAYLQRTAVLPPTAVPAPAVGVVSPNRIYIGNIYFEIGPTQLEAVFSSFGRILSCQLINNPETGRHKGYGFIEFDNPVSAQQAIDAMDNFDLCGRSLRVRRPNAPSSSAAAAGMAPINYNAMIPNPSAVYAAAAAAVAAAAAQSAASHGAWPQSPMSGAAAAAVAAAAATASIAAAASSPPTTSQVSVPNPQAQTPPASKETVSKCIAMLNLVNPDEVDDELRGEVKEEAAKYGAVSDVIVHVDKLNPSGERVVVFVVFETADSASKAKTALDRRFFGGRIITARYYSEDLLHSQHYLTHPVQIQ